MDFERIQLLLSVFHDSLDVPFTDKIRAEIITELKEINEAPLPADPADEPEEPELGGGRRL